ncbi:MAG: Uma2 family endonuclease, partial [Deltaproteobacteria bacterium]|nr:Uma2 family endonuclease [Deltaproteobacteria bacterium]
MSATAAERVELVVGVPRTDPRWVLDDDEEKMPESPLHVAICNLLEALLAFWVLRRGASALVGRNLAVRWDAKRPRFGVDPDVYLVEPAPPFGPRDKSLRTWLKGHRAPRVAVEVVSEATAAEDYGVKPAKYAASGTRELWIFDPLRVGPLQNGGPFVLQVWRRDRRGALRRVFAGDGPARSTELGAWLVVTDGGLRLRIAEDEEGRGLWPTEAEAERA